MADSRSPRRIACLQPSATVILAAVGALGRVVACTKYCADVVPEVRDNRRMIIADSWTAKADEILAAKPDLVIAAVPYQEEAVSEILKAGIRFLALAPRTLDDIYTDISVIASLVGARGCAAASSRASTEARLLRGVGKACYRVPALGGGSGGRCGGRVLGRSGPAVRCERDSRKRP